MGKADPGKREYRIYQGKEILYVDYVNMDESTCVDQINYNNATFMEEVAKGRCDLLQLVNITGTFGTPKVIDALKAAAKMMKPYTKKTAVIGVVGIKKVLMNAVNIFSGIGAKAFDTKQEAEAWLIAD